MAGRTDAGTDRAFPLHCGHQGVGWLWWVTVLAVAFGLAATLLSAWRASETPDEPVHLEWSRRLLLERVTERRSNEYFESKSPVSMLNVVARRLARRVAAGDDEPRRGCVLRFASRLPTAFLFAILLAAVFLAARAWPRWTWPLRCSTS